VGAVMADESSLLGLGLRQPPANVQAEQALLGGLLASNKAYDGIAGWLKPEHFADPAHGAIYAAIARRIDAGRLADALLLAREMSEWAHGFKDDAEATAYLSQLLAAMVSARDVRHYAEAVVDAWHRRALIEIGSELVRRAFEPGEASARSIHEATEEALAQLADGNDGDAGPVAAHEAMQLAIEEAWKARDVPGGLVGLTTGLRALDDATGGLRAGEMITIGARPSMGKTTLGLSISAGAAAAGARVLFVTLEMTPADLGAQITAGLTPISRNLTTRGKERYQDDIGRFRWRPVTEAEIGAMLAAQRAMASRRLLIQDLRVRTMQALRAVVRRLVRQGGLDLVVIDYIGLLRVPELARFDNRTLEVTRISGDIKALAVDFHLPVVALSQLNRQVEGRDVKRPGLSDLRDSGALEQDSDVVMFLHRDEYYLNRKKVERGEKESAEDFASRRTLHFDRLKQAEGRASIYVDKLRKGAIDEVEVAFGNETTWFTDLPEEAPF
jgi:replicative DNA helicase